MRKRRREVKKKIIKTILAGLLVFDLFADFADPVAFWWMVHRWCQAEHVVSAVTTVAE